MVMAESPRWLTAGSSGDQGDTWSFLGAECSEYLRLACEDFLDQINETSVPIK